MKVRSSFADLLKYHLARGTGRTEIGTQSGASAPAARSWSNEEFSLAVGKSTRTIAYWKSGKKLPDDCDSVARVFFGATVDTEEKRDLLVACSTGVVQTGGGGQSVLDAHGEWIAVYVERDRLGDPYCVREAVKSIQVGVDLQGVFHCLTCPRDDFQLNAVVFGDVVLGTFFCPARSTMAYGRGAFELKALRNNEWLEGLSIWYDMDSARVEHSKNIWFRMDRASSESYERDAAELMAAEIRKRKKFNPEEI